MNNNQGINIDYSMFDTYGRGAETLESKNEEEAGWGVKIIELSKTNDISVARSSTPGEEKQSVGVVLTKKPSGNVDVRVSITNTRNLKIANPKITFTPGNWQIPQEIKLEGCADASIKLTLPQKPEIKVDSKEQRKTN